MKSQSGGEMPPRSSPQTAAEAGPASAAPQDERPPDPHRPRSKSLAEIMLEKAMITRGQLEKALQVQQRGGGALGRILIKMDAITEEELAQVLALYWDLPSVSLKALKVDPDTVKTIPQHISYRHKVIAVERIRTRLRLAIADPANVKLLTMSASSPDWMWIRSSRRRRTSSPRLDSTMAPRWPWTTRFDRRWAKQWIRRKVGLGHPPRNRPRRRALRNSS